MHSPLFFPLDGTSVNEITKWITDRAAEIEYLKGDIKSLRAQLVAEAATIQTLKNNVNELKSNNTEQWQPWRHDLERRESKLSTEQNTVKKAREAVVADRAGLDNLGVSLMNFANTMINDVQSALSDFHGESEEKIALSCFQ